MHLHLHCKLVPLGNGYTPQGIKEESSTLTLFEIAGRSLDRTQQDVLQKSQGKVCFEDIFSDMYLASIYVIKISIMKSFEMQ